MTQYTFVLPHEYVVVEQAAEYVGRAPRTIYDWIKTDGVRSMRVPGAKLHVHIEDVIRVDALRAQGPRRKPRLPRVAT